MKIAYIPISLHASQVPNQQLLLLDGHPMISYVVRSCKKAEVFDRIVVDADSKEFQQLASMLGAEYQQREKTQPSASQQEAWRSEIEGPVTAFIKKVSNEDQVFLVNPNAPLVKPETLREFAKRFDQGDCDALLSVVESEDWIGGSKPELKQTQRVSWALGAWSAKRYQGSLFSGRTEHFSINKIEALEARNWDDVRMIEAQLVHARQKYEVGKFSVPKHYKSIEHELEGLMERDGVATFHDAGINIRKSNIEEIKAKMGKAPWCYFLFYTATDQTALICQAPGEGARTHCHVTHDEWWVVLEGEFEWRLGDRTVTTGKAGDIVFLPRGTIHTIVCTSKTDGIRLACGARDMEHIYF